jgi:hypothetical protein
MGMHGLTNGRMGGKSGEWAAGVTPAQPVILSAPDCQGYCSWTVISVHPFLVRLKLVHGNCRAHRHLDQQPWSWEQYRDSMTLRPVTPADGYLPLTEPERPGLPLPPRLCADCGSRRVLPGWPRCGPCIGIVNAAMKSA